MNRCLEIGPGEQRLGEGWVTLDMVPHPGVVDHVCRWGDEPLPFGDESFDLVYACHVLEHIPWYQTISALQEAWRILAPGGVLEIHVPDFDLLATAVRHEFCPDQHAEEGVNRELHWMHWVAERLFHLGPESQWHRACFNASHLEWSLRQAGFDDLERVSEERASAHGVMNLGMRGKKAAYPSSGPQRQPLLSSKRAENSRTKDLRVPASYSPEVEMVPGAEELPLCHSRREFDAGSKTFFCAHPNVHTAQNLVGMEICRMCQKWQEPPPEEFRLQFHVAANDRQASCWHLGKHIGLRDCASCRGNVKLKVFSCGHVDHEVTTLEECRQCPDYEPRLGRGSIRNWALGITTAPRKVPTLCRTVASLMAAGWQEVIVFAEPDSEIPEGENGISVVRRAALLGEWPNWYLGLSELYQRNPTADAYLMLQDDVVLSRNLRNYLEASLWPADTLGVVSLYNPLPSKNPKTGFELFPSAPGLPGALALVFPNAAARQILADRTILLHRRRGPTIGTRLTDIVVGEWADRSGWPAYIHSPSLCQHIGETTTVWQPEQDLIVRQAASFQGEQFDARCWEKKMPLV